MEHKGSVPEHVLSSIYPSFSLDNLSQSHSFKSYLHADYAQFQMSSLSLYPEFQIPVSYYVLEPVNWIHNGVSNEACPKCSYKPALIAISPFSSSGPSIFPTA